MSARRASLSLLVATALAGPAAPAEGARWLRVRAPGFEMVTDLPEPQALEAARRLARFRDVLRRAAPVPPVEVPALVVLAPSRAETFRTVRPPALAGVADVEGFVEGGRRRTIIVVNAGRGAAASGRLAETLCHEYVHVALNGALPAQPLWVAEGLAELYSGWEESEGAVRWGRARADHLRLLRGGAALPLARLLNAGYTSPEFLDPRTRGVIYAQSWALVHHLLAGRPDGGQRLLALLHALAQGADPAAAARSALGQGLRAWQAELDAYVPAAPPALPAAAVGEPPAPAQAEPASAGTVELLLGELLHEQERDAEARRFFEAALAADARLAGAHEGLAAVALRRGRREEAREHLDAAVALLPEDPAVLYRRAELLLREAHARGEVLSGAEEESAVAALERAVELSPAFADAADLLARLRPRPHALRIRMLEHALARHPARTDLAITLAGLHLRVDDAASAAAALVRARDAARDEALRFLATHLLGRLGRSAAGTAEATGRLAALECAPGGGLDFLVHTEGGPLRLRAAGPESLLLYGPDGEQVQAELPCGPHARPVRVRYRLPAGAGRHLATADGTLLTLRFVE